MKKWLALLALSLGLMAAPADAQTFINRMQSPACSASQFPFSVNTTTGAWSCNDTFVSSVASSGATGGFVQDATSYIQAALTARASAGGGVVKLDPSKSYYASGTITIPNNVTLSCDGPGLPVYQSPLNYTAKTCAIYSAVTGTTPAIINNGGLDGVTILQDRVRTIGNPTTRALHASLVSGFTGIGVQIGNGTNPGPANDTVLKNVIIGGFGTCINLNYSSQDRWDTVFEDCTNGAAILDSHDDTIIRTLHFWPFLTTNRTHAADQWTISGIADNGSGGIRVTTSTTNDLATGEYLFVYYSAGELPGAQSAFGRWQITVIDSTHFDLNGATWSPAPTGSTTSGLDYLSVASTAGLARGQSISGTNIPVGATITAVWYGQNRISISAPATGTGSGIALTVTNSAYSGSAIAYANQNWRSGTALAITNSEGVQGTDIFTYSAENGIVLSGSTNVALSQVQTDSVISTLSGAALKFTGASYGNTINAVELNTGGTSIVSTTSGPAASLMNTIIGATYKATANLLQATGGGVNIIGASVRDNNAPILYSNGLSPGLVGVNAPNALVFSNVYPATTYRRDSSTVLASGASLPPATFGSVNSTEAFPTFAWKGTAQSADKKNWDAYLDATGNLNWRSLNDAYGAANTWMQFTRGSGYSLGTINVYAGLAVASISGNGSALTSLTRSQISDFGTGVSTALGNALNASGGVVGYSGALGTPTSVTLTNATGLPVSTGLTGAGTGVVTALGNAVTTNGGLMTNYGNYNNGIALNGSAPTCAATSAGTGAACAMSGGSSASSGTIAITAGTAAGSSGSVTLTFANTMIGSSTPVCLAGYDDTGSSAWAAAAAHPHVSAISTSAVTFTWDNAGSGLTSTKSYRIMYHCFGK